MSCFPFFVFKISTGCVIWTTKTWWGYFISILLNREISTIEIWTESINQNTCNILPLIPVSWLFKYQFTFCFFLSTFGAPQDYSLGISVPQEHFQAFWDIAYGFNKIEVGNFQNKLLKLQDIHGNKILKPTNKRKEQNRFSLNEKGELIKDKGGPAKLFEVNKNLSSFNLAIAPPKKR